MSEKSLSGAEVSAARARRRSTIAVLLLCIVPAAILLLSLIGPFRTDAVYHHSGIVFDAKSPVLNGEPSIEPNIGTTSQALGTRAALDIAAGHWPLWNHFEGLGSPLLGEMQSAALFPPTLLMLLPHGQGIEHLFLEALGGFGTFLFFRKFGLGRRPAVIGAVAFEVNGIYAWLRNAIFNPVAFLPWLFFALEGMIANAAGGLALRRRLPAVGLGAVAASLSLYAGFPEEVYLYGLMLVAWTAFRAAFLPRRAVISLATDIALTGIVALLLSAPLLAAFTSYLPEAELMQHGGGGFAAESLGRESMLQYIAPYIYGRIFANPRPAIEGSWGGIGGYIGFAPLVLAAASQLLPRRRVTKLFLLAWIVVTVGTSHGLPVVQQAFNAIPLVADAASYRYLDASWIFALLFLSALFIDEAPAVTPTQLRRTMTIAVAIGLGLIGVAIAEAWPLLSDLLGGSAHEARTVAFALLAVALVAVALMAAAFVPDRGWAVTLVGGVMVFEALAWFAYPSLSYPRGGVLDGGLVSFLRSRAGFQRVVSSSGAALGNNYGSYFGISSIHFDDLPVSKRTNDYITSHVDPLFGGTNFTPGEDGASPEVRDESVWLARLRLPAYAAAGVKFALSGPGYENAWPYNVGYVEQESDPYSMPPGSQIEVRLTQDARTKPLQVTGLSVGLAASASAGTWATTVCAGETCVDGRAESSADEDGPVAVHLDRPVVIEPEKELTIRLRLVGGGPASLRMVRLAGQEGRPAIAGTAGPVVDGAAPDIRLGDGGVTPVYDGQAASVYELADVRPYLSAEDCTVEAPSRDSMDLDCRRPSSLVRLEVSMAGWSVTVNGEPTSLGTLEDTFQTIAVPAGRSHVNFSFAPRGFRVAVALAGLALIVLLGIAALSVMERWRRRAHAG